MITDDVKRNDNKDRNKRNKRDNEHGRGKKK